MSRRNSTPGCATAPPRIPIRSARGSSGGLNFSPISRRGAGSRRPRRLAQFGLRRFRWQEAGPGGPARTSIGVKTSGGGHKMLETQSTSPTLHGGLVDHRGLILTPMGAVRAAAGGGGGGQAAGDVGAGAARRRVVVGGGGGAHRPSRSVVWSLKSDSVVYTKFDLCSGAPGAA